MQMTDKAVSTEDLCSDDTLQNPLIGVARLEAILNTLVENKVESIKNESRKAQSLQSTPKKILDRFRLTSSPAIIIKNKERTEDEIKHKKKVKRKHKHHSAERRPYKKQRLKHDVSISSPESQRFQHRVRSCECSSASEDDRNKTDINHDNTCTAECSSCDKPSTCCCSNDHAQILHFEDEYISLKIEDCDAAADAAARDEALRKARRKRRRRRKRKMKKRLAMGQIVDVEAVHHNFKDYDEDDLPQPAKWTIVVTACLLLFMCLLLVGITLRMAPIIDEMGAIPKRKEPLIPSSDEVDQICKLKKETKRKNLKTLSLEDLYLSKQKLKQITNDRRRNSYQPRREELDLSRRNSSKYFTRNNSGHKRISRQSQDFVLLDKTSLGGLREYPRNSRRLSNRSFKESSYDLPRDSQVKKRHSRIVYFLIIGFYFLLIVSVFTVLITLTHHSFYKDVGSNSSVLNDSSLVRKEYDEVLQKLQEGYNSTTSVQEHL